MPHTTTVGPDIAAQRAFLQGQPDENVACRQRHPYPVIGRMKNGRLPKSLEAIGPYRDGVYVLRQVCPSCGSARWMLTGEGGELRLPGKWHREYAEGYLAKGLGRISQRLAAEEGYARIVDELFATARKPADIEEMQP